MSKAHKIEVEVTREITFTVEVTIEAVDDDDGCGSPSSTGNSMTGRRGTTKYVAGEIWVVDAKAVKEAAEKACDWEDSDIAEAVENAAND